MLNAECSMPNADFLPGSCFSIGHSAFGISSAAFFISLPV
jgi:hypothetical protein